MQTFLMPSGEAIYLASKNHSERRQVATHQVQKEYLLLLNTMVKKNFDGLDTRTPSGLIIMVSCKLSLCKMYIISPSIGSRRRIYR